MFRIFGVFRNKKRIEEQESVMGNKSDVTGNEDTVSTQDVTRVTYLENPLPVPKKHEKRTMDFAVDKKTDDFDILVDENDDFDV